MLADTLSRLMNLEITEPSILENEGHEYGYALFEQLPDIHVSSSKHNPVQPVNISNINATNENVVQNKDNENTEIHLSLSTEELIDGQNNDTFCVAIIQLNEEKNASRQLFYKW